MEPGSDNGTPLKLERRDKYSRKSGSNVEKRGGVKGILVI
jgi:hypothetical protein